jgi:hypothetical protein
MLKAAAKSGEVTDQQLYKMACDAKGEIEKPKAAPAAQNDFMHWELVQYPDGAVYCFNPNNGKIYAALRPGTRGFSYVGPSSFLSKLGGRGEISQLVSMLEDGDYLHTREKKR